MHRAGAQPRGEEWRGILRAAVACAARKNGAPVTDRRADAPQRRQTDLTIQSAAEGPGAPTGGTLTTTHSSGIAHFDPKIGQVVSKSSTTTLSGKITVDAQKGFSIQQEQTNSITVELLDELPD